MIVLGIILAFIFGVAVGLFGYRMVELSRNVTGAFIVNTENAEEDYMKLSIHNPDDIFIKNKKYVKLHIVENGNAR